MPNLDDHLSAARNNERFSEDLIAERRYLDWAVTGMFYAAIHYVEAYLSLRTEHSLSHRMRDSEIASDPKLINIFDHYSDLKNDSTQSRYECHIFPVQEVVSRIQPNLVTIKNHISGLLV